ncbi:MAG: hypothetical protein KBT36_09565 [Kurthia sp.]|nr:hypothetical protein [Candidatus Kurthia equi]
MYGFEFKKLPTMGRVVNVLDDLEKPIVWHMPSKEIIVIFHQEVTKEREYCYWYSGGVATIILNNKHIIKLNAIGDVQVTYKQKSGEIICRVNDHLDAGKFLTQFDGLLNSDSSLINAFQRKLFTLGNPNWQIDVYDMRKCPNLLHLIQLQLFEVESYIGALKGSYELESYFFSDALYNISQNRNIYLEVSN